MPYASLGYAACENFVGAASTRPFSFVTFVSLGYSVSPNAKKAPFVHAGVFGPRSGQVLFIDAKNGIKILVLDAISSIGARIYSSKPH